MAKSLSEEIMHVLTESTVPMSTPDLIALLVCDKPNNRALVWCRLRFLERKGLIMKSHGKTPNIGRGGNQKCAFWSLSKQEACERVY